MCQPKSACSEMELAELAIIIDRLQERERERRRLTIPVIQLTQGGVSKSVSNEPISLI